MYYFTLSGEILSVSSYLIPEKNLGRLRTCYGWPPIRSIPNFLSEKPEAGEQWNQYISDLSKPNVHVIVISVFQIRLVTSVIERKSFRINMSIRPRSYNKPRVSSLPHYCHGGQLG